MNDKEQNTGVAEREIDLIDMVSKLWASRRFILKWVGYAAVLGLVVAFSIPARIQCFGQNGRRRFQR